MRPSTFQHPRNETHRHQQVVWKKSHCGWLEALRHQFGDTLPPCDLLHHTIDRRRCFRGSTLGLELLLPLLLLLPPLLLLHFFHSCSLCSCPCGSCLCCLFLYLHGMSPHRSAQPASLNGHRGQESQSRARNHVLAALDSTCREPPCTPDRLRADSCQHYTLLPRESRE